MAALAGHPWDELGRLNPGCSSVEDVLSLKDTLSSSALSGPAGCGLCQ